MSEYLFTSARLGFRNWKQVDLEPYAALNQDPRVMEFFPSTNTLEECKEHINSLKKRFENWGFTFFAVDELASGNFMGFIGLSKPSFETEFTPCVEIGWRLAHAFWGKGYATEGAKACLNFGFHEMGIEEIFSWTAILNVRSEKVMKKIGMQKVGEFDHPKMEKGHILERHVLYKTHKAK